MPLSLKSSMQQMIVKPTFKKPIYKGILDSLSSSSKTNLVGIYAFKKCFTTYDGPVVQIRRASDNATQNFYADSTGVLGTNVNGTGTSLSSWLTATTGYVTIWYDQSGRGVVMSQSTTSYQPQILLSDGNGICLVLNTIIPNTACQLQTSTTGVWSSTTTSNFHVFTAIKTVTNLSGFFNFTLNLTPSTSRAVAQIPWTDGKYYFDAPQSNRAQYLTANYVPINSIGYFSMWKSTTSNNTGIKIVKSDRTSTVTATGTNNTTANVTMIGLNNGAGSNAPNTNVYVMAVFTQSINGTSDETLLINSF